MNIYILDYGDVVKIGKANDIAQRINTLKSDHGIPNKLGSYYFEVGHALVFKVERGLHGILHEYRNMDINGEGYTEFFTKECIGELVDIINVKGYTIKPIDFSKIIPKTKNGVSKADLPVVNHTPLVKKARRGYNKRKRHLQLFKALILPKMVHYNITKVGNIIRCNTDDVWIGCPSHRKLMVWLFKYCGKEWWYTVGDGYGCNTPISFQSCKYDDGQDANFVSCRLLDIQPDYVDVYDQPDFLEYYHSVMGIVEELICPSSESFTPTLSLVFK